MTKRVRVVRSRLNLRKFMFAWEGIISSANKQYVENVTKKKL